LESEAIAGSFRKAGFRFVPWDSRPQEPGIIIVNTCTVTSKADQKARRMIRKLLKDNPESCVVVTGCYAQLDTEEIMALENDAGTGNAGGGRRLFVLGGGEGAAAAKSALLGLPRYLSDAIARKENSPGGINPLSCLMESWMRESAPSETSEPSETSAVKNDSVFDFKPEDFSFHSRGFIKIQDGCDSSCAYCRVRLARGRSVSLNRKAALERLRFFEEKTSPELFITGVNISQYRDDDLDLAGLLELLLAGTDSIALRLSSLEPECIDERLASALAHPRIRPHFHLCLQSGSDAILKSMRRAYNLHTVEKAIALLRLAKDNPFLACDIITGFPGETEAEFAKTLAFCEETNFSWIHAFPYSDRPGTAAFSFENHVREQDKTRRVQVLGALALRGRREYAKSWLGKELSAVVEKDKPNAGQPGLCRAVSENYLKLLVNCNGKPPPPGSSIRCVPVSVCEGEDADAIADSLFPLPILCYTN
jgi:threonylcarbamoyladenosine tRNA methylthiotransferase MtaB